MAWQGLGCIQSFTKTSVATQRPDYWSRYVERQTLPDRGLRFCLGFLHTRNKP